MDKTIIKIKHISGIFSLLFILLIHNIAFAQLAPVANPLFTQPVADALAIPKFVNPLPIVPRLDFTSGGTTNMYMGVGTHDFVDLWQAPYGQPAASKMR